ncbi:MAG: amino-acid N-acetyltransferase [Candidatus Methylacidiphilales bacterium]
MAVTDLRGILGYISRFRDKIFVLSLDSVVLADDNFHKLALDVSVLRSLNIRVVLVHGASYQMKVMARGLGVEPSDLEGMGMTDEPTLRLAIAASNVIAHQLLEELSELDQRAAVTNAIIAHPAGIISGADQGWTGKVEKVDAGFLEGLMASNVIPVIPPLGFDGNGRTYRVNSDGVALEVAEALHAAKLIFVTSTNGVGGGGKLSTQFSVDEAAEFLRNNRAGLAPDLVSKLEHGLRACRNGVSRSHIIDGTQDDALLSEIFSNEGIGTMIYANEYQAIRRARKKDVRRVMDLIKESVNNQEILARSRAELTERIGDFFLFEIDKNILGCVALRIFPEEKEVAELECLSVASTHENQGIGRKLMQYAESKAREMGVRLLLALSTQAFNYFQQKGGFLEGTPELLPKERLAKYLASGRNSKVLYKNIA